MHFLATCSLDGGLTVLAVDMLEWQAAGSDLGGSGGAILRGVVDCLGLLGAAFFRKIRFCTLRHMSRIYVNNSSRNQLAFDVRSEITQI